MFAPHAHEKRKMVIIIVVVITINYCYYYYHYYYFCYSYFVKLTTNIFAFVPIFLRNHNLDFVLPKLSTKIAMQITTIDIQF